MKKIATLISILFLISGCSGSNQMSPEDIQATIDVGIVQTQQSNPTSTYTNTPTHTPEPTNTLKATSTPASTNTPQPTDTPDPNTIASDFIYYFKENFQFYAKT